MSDLQQRRTITSPTDLLYVRAQFLAIEQARTDLPAPSYYDASGAAYVPRNYLEQEADRERFLERAAAEINLLGATYDPDAMAVEWGAYWNGIYGMCLKDNSPENIVRKNWLIERIEAMVQAPRSEESWLDELRVMVDELDALERPFCDFDRTYFGGSVSRDRCITNVRERFFSTARPRREPV